MGRPPALALLVLALMLGAGLRLYRLSAAELSADEAASWAGAAAPDLRTVIERERALDPGKLALYDLALHGWIALGGDGVGSMRAFSAALGILTIALAFAATRELLLSLGGAAEIPQAMGGAAIAALIVAVNPTLIEQAQTVRMYPLTLVLELLQLVFFLRAVSTRARGAGRIASLAGIMVFSALATASNFTAALLIAAEVMWLGWVAVRRRIAARACDIGELQLLPPLLALCAGMALLAPMAPTTGRASIAAVQAGVLNWSHARPLWWPFEMLRAASGKVPFMLLLPLAWYGGWRMRRDGGAAFGFVLWWMLVPIALVMTISYAFVPFEETRYVIGSVAAFFILAGIGLAAIDDARWRLGLLVLVVALSLDHVRRDFKKPHDLQWREAAALALATAQTGGAIVVVPGYAVNVVRYYMPAQRRQSAEDTGDRCETRGRVLILGKDDLLAPAQLAALRNCYPLVVGRWRLIEVRKR